MELLARHGCKVSIAMESDIQMGMGIPPLRKCLELGMKPSLSIDTSAAVAPDLFSQMKLALQTQRMLDHNEAHSRRECPMTLGYGVRDALSWATRNGADTVGMADRIGTLTPGKRADIVFISSKRALSASAYPLGTAVLHSTPADVDTVMVDGHIRKRDGRLVGVDVQAIRKQAKEGLQRIMKNLESMRPEMNSDEIKAYFLAIERSGRKNMALAYSDHSVGGADAFRL